MKAKVGNRNLIVNYMYKGVLYSDTLHSSEINPCREWLDTVVSIEDAPSLGNEGTSQILVYNEARAFLKDLAAFNDKSVNSI